MILCHFEEAPLPRDRVVVLMVFEKVSPSFFGPPHGKTAGEFSEEERARGRRAKIFFDGPRRFGEDRGKKLSRRCNVIELVSQFPPHCREVRPELWDKREREWDGQGLWDKREREWDGRGIYSAEGVSNEREKSSIRRFGKK